MLFAHVFRVGAIEHDLLHVAGLAIAVVLLGPPAYRLLQSATVDPDWHRAGLSKEDATRIECMVSP